MAEEQVHGYYSLSSSSSEVIKPTNKPVGELITTPKLSPSSSFSSRSKSTGQTMCSRFCRRVSKMFFELSRKLEGRKSASNWNSKFSRALCTIETQHVDNNGRITKGSYPEAFVELDQCTEGGNIISRSFLEEELKLEHLMEPLTALDHKHPMVCANGDILRCRGSIKLTFTIRPLDGHISLNFSTATYRDIPFFVTESFNTPFQLLLGDEFLQNSRILAKRANYNHIAPPRGKEVEIGRQTHRDVEDQQKKRDAEIKEFERKKREKERLEKEKKKNQGQSSE